MNTQEKINVSVQETFVAEQVPGTPPLPSDGGMGALKADTVIIDPVPPADPMKTLQVFGGTDEPPEVDPGFLGIPDMPGLEPLPGVFPPSSIMSGQESGEVDDMRPMPADCQAATAEQEEQTLFLRTAATQPRTPSASQRAALEKGGRVRRGIKAFFKGVGGYFRGARVGRGALIGAVANGIGDAIPENGALEVVIGMDDRILITDTTASPFSGCTQLDIVAANDREYVGSAACIAMTQTASVFLTAAHCVYYHGNGGPARSITLSPGRDVDNSPFGKFTVTPGENIGAFYIPGGWSENRARDADWALIVVPHRFTSADDQTPFVFDFNAFSDIEIAEQVGQVSGYPVDLTNLLMDATRQFFHFDKVSALTSGVISYQLDTTGGQSGSPFWFFDVATGARAIAGVHTMGDSTGNSATRITPEIQAAIEATLAQVA